MSEVDLLERIAKRRPPATIAPVDGPGPEEASKRPLRVLHVCESLPGGTSSYLDEILPYQSFRFGAENVTLLAPESQAGHLRRADPRSFVGYRRTGRDLASVTSLAAALRRELEARRPDVLHLHSSIAGAVGRVVAAGVGFEGRVVYCAHGWAMDPGRRSRMRPLFSLAEQVLYRVSDAIVNISPHEAGFQPPSWLNGSKVHLIQSGIAPSGGSAAAAAEPVDDARPWRLLFVGRTDRQKGFDLLMAEMVTLQGRAKLSVVGGAVVEEACTAPPPPNVQMLGWLAREQVDVKMRRSDFVVMPSRWEGMPLVALEAMRAGCPVIASDQGAFPHIIRDGVDGLLVDIAAPGFLGRALAGRSRADARRMGAAARRTFEQRFMSGDMNRRLVALYHEVCSRPALRAHGPAVMASRRMAGAT